MCPKPLPPPVVTTEAPLPLPEPEPVPEPVPAPVPKPVPSGMGMGRNLRGGGPIDFDEQAPSLSESYSYNPSLSNVDWKNFDLEQFSNALQCAKLPSERPIHGVDTWHQLRQTYENVVGPQRSSISRVLANVEAKGDQQLDMPVAAQDSNALSVEHVPGKGRGLVAAKDIKKGEKMWSDLYMGECDL